MSGVTYVKERPQDATTTKKGIVKLAGDLGGTADAPTVVNISPDVTITLAGGGTGANLSATGPGLLAQASSGATVTLLSTSAGIAGAISDETGTGALVFANTPTLVTPVLGVATATTVNKVALTQPATGSTLTIADGKTLTASNSLTLAGTDDKSLTLTGSLIVPADGTAALLGTANVFTANQRVDALVGVNVAPTASQQLTVLAGSTSTVGLVVDTPASPTANLAEFRNNTTAKFSIDKDGKFTSAATTAVFGSYTLTVPATGTAALLGTANTFAANQTIDAGYRLNVDTATRVQQAVGGAYFLKNAIWNGSAWEYVTTATAATVGLPVNGGIQLRIAASGTAGNPITWTTAVTLNTTGHLLVGTATDSAQLTVLAGSTSTVGLVVDTPASPTANIAEFRNNTTAKFTIDKDGKMTSAATTAVFGAYTLTIPATGTAALLGTANTFTAAQTFSVGIRASAVDSDTAGIGAAIVGGGNYWAMRTDTGHNFHIDTYDGSYNSRVKLFVNGHLSLNTATDSGQLTVKAGSTSTVGLVVDTPASTTSESISLRYNGSERVRFLNWATLNAIYLTSFDNGTGAGSFFYAQKNSNGSTPAAGFVYLDGLSNSYSIWPDTSGNLRILAGSFPINASDTAGTVIGTQTSTLASKILLGGDLTPGEALRTILQTPVKHFKYKSDAYNGSEFHGIVADYSPNFRWTRAGYSIPFRRLGIWCRRSKR
jgi:hypothetical protein